jgi:hypothetical protein
LLLNYIACYYVGTPLVAVNSYALVNELSDDKRFKKHVGPALSQVRNLLGDALFTVSILDQHHFISGN